MNFNIGQKIVCVDDSPAQWSGENLLRQGSVYVVESNDEIGCPHLVGIKSPLGIAWRIERFRSLEEMKQEAAERQSALITHIKKLAQEGKL